MPEPSGGATLDPSRKVGLLEESFNLFNEYRPSHVASFILSAFCALFAVGLSLVPYLQEGFTILNDMTFYFVALALCFFVYAVALRREEQD